MKIDFTLNIKDIGPLTQIKSVLEMSKIPLKIKALPDKQYILVSGTSFIKIDMEPSEGPDYECSGSFQASEEVAIKNIKTLSLALHADGIQHQIELKDETGKKIASAN